VSYKDGGTRGKCGKHGGLPRCIACERFSVKKKGLRCSYCRPESAIAKWAKKEEEAMEIALTGLKFEREVRIDYKYIDSGDKHFARLDFVLDLPDKQVILEVDERQHKGAYTIQCDVLRMTYVMGAIARTKNVHPTLWIRFNPDGFKVDGKTTRVSRKARYAKLLSVIHETVAVFSGTRVLYMYYDVTSGMPSICQDVSYSDQMKKLLCPCIH
jgi:very-short-patch-repair endonuclease